MESNRVYRFQVELVGDVIWDGAMPIRDEYGTLIGGFTVYRGNVIWGFVGGSGYPASSRVSSGQSFWFTSQPNQSGQIVSGILSECPLKQSGVVSTLVIGATEEASDVR